MSLVFTYGPDASPSKMRDRIRSAKLVGGALLEGFRLSFDKPNVKKRGEGLPNLSEDAEAKTFGTLYEVPDGDLEMLDGFFGGYARKPVTVNMRGEQREASTWFARRTGRNLKPSRASIDLAAKALEEAGAPKPFIEALSQIEVL